jgi:hypothetical protein
MKILYINSGSPDYLADTLFHGLRKLYGVDVVDCPKMDHMYSNSFPESEMKTWGKGFTIFRTLEDIDVDRNHIFKKINDKYFDLIIWGSIHRNLSYFYSAIDSKTKCIFLDGEDQQQLHSITPHITWRSSYFKRELDYRLHQNIKPIGFSFPKEKIDAIYNKLKTSAKVVPGYQETYIFNKEDEYYNDYKTSYYAITHKKGGWDCMRHYEIIFNNCIPYFTDIESCPQNTLTFLPKELLIEAKNLPGVVLSNNSIPCIEINDMVFDEQKYKTLLETILNYCKNTCTTEQMAKYVLNNIV